MRQIDAREMHVFFSISYGLFQVYVKPVADPIIWNRERGGMVGGGVLGEAVHLCQKFYAK